MNIQRTGEIRIHDTTVSVWEECVEPAMRLVFRALRGHLRRRSFAIDREARIAQDKKAMANPYIRDSYWDGRKGDLELYANTGGRTISVEFFQNVANVENKNGGRYDFDKMKRMPRGLRLRCAVEMACAVRYLMSLGYTLHPKFTARFHDVPLPLAILHRAEWYEWEGRSPLENFNRGWGADRFKRDETGWPAASEHRGSYGAFTENGATRYLYEHGRLVRGQCFTDMNSSASVYLADGSLLTHVSSSDLIMPAVAEGQLAQRPRRSRRRALTTAEQAAKLQKQLQKAVLAQNWNRVAVLGKLLSQRWAAENACYLLRDTRSGAWWRPLSAGYTSHVDEAGRYSEAEARNVERSSHGQHRAVPVRDVQRGAA